MFGGQRGWVQLAGDLSQQQRQMVDFWLNRTAILTVSEKWHPLMSNLIWDGPVSSVNTRG